MSTNRLKFLVGFLLILIGSLLYLYYSYYSSTYSNYVLDYLLPDGFSILLIFGAIFLGSYMMENWRNRLPLTIIIIVSFFVFVAIPIAFYWDPIIYRTVHGTRTVVFFYYLPAFLPAILAILLLFGIFNSIITNSRR